MKKLSRTHKIFRFGPMNSNDPNPVTFESREERYILPTGGEERIVETDAFYLQSGKQAMPEDVLVKCRGCGGITDMKSAFECTGCHRTLCRDHLKREEIIRTKVVQKQDAQGRQTQYEHDQKRRYCPACWRSESLKRAVKWIITAIFSPLVFLKKVLQEDGNGAPTINRVESNQPEDDNAETINS